ncbi:DUF308 domain-containing protein [Roseomonas elaeocarpi]|uniref:DUF308 domain-containing protein n=1 Tax=Roseomonas elaeocarpi TaxID=907779 RepID=A0ABV6JXK8_9PROT
MQPDTAINWTSASRDGWLKPYYFTRAAFSLVWVALAFGIGRSDPVAAAVLFISYPAWDALANYADARRNGGLARNRSQSLNLAVSALTTVAVIVALGQSLAAVISVFGVWAFLAGLFQLLTGVRRWKAGAQWAMVLSGAQSALAGVLFIGRAASPDMRGVTDIAPYAAFGAFYFLVSAVWLTVADLRRGAVRIAG